MSKHYSRMPEIHRPRKHAKQRRLGHPAFGRRPNFERLERRDLLTAGMDSGDVELLTVAALFDESAVPDEVVDVSEESSAMSDPAVPTLMLFSKDVSVAADEEIETEIVLLDESGFPVPTRFSEEFPAAEETTVTFAAFGGEVLDGEVFEEVDGGGDYYEKEAAFTSFDGEVLKGEAFEEGDEGVAYYEKEFAFTPSDGEVLDGELDVVDQPLLLRSLADADVKADVAMFDESEPPMPSAFEDDTIAPEETFVTFTAQGGEALDGEADVVDEPVLMRNAATDTEGDVADGDLVDGDVVEGDPSEELMLYAAMGPSPWQNLDNPDDVNVDGWTTPMDALLIINPVNEGVSLSALTAAPASLFVDVNGDRILDANDAIQVINTLNAAGEAPIAADAARRMAPSGTTAT